MTAKEKAEELVKKMMAKRSSPDKYDAIAYAIICVEEIIDDYKSWRVKTWLTLEAALELAEFWEEVLTELKKL